jgi:hypothetical protein
MANSLSDRFEQASRIQERKRRKSSRAITTNLPPRQPAEVTISTAQFAEIISLLKEIRDRLSPLKAEGAS